MTIAGRFQAALRGMHQPGLAGPELLPVRLARATARTLQVNGAGISVLDGGQQPFRLGASSDATALAERLQLTAGEGPCLTARRSRQPVFALEADLRRRWPAFCSLLLARTPFRAVVALPLQPALVGAGALDLFFERPEDVTELDVFEALAVGELVNSALSDAVVWSEWSPADVPEWLRGEDLRFPGRDG
ncbi:MAG: GAF domain-containing protein [Geodermatophilales bacterium]|nr:GAF domain-containing protein [Geodermatophilales bacterium]